MTGRFVLDLPIQNEQVFPSSPPLEGQGWVRDARGGFANPPQNCHSQNKFNSVLHC
jgi:hypothetical protein